MTVTVVDLGGLRGRARAPPGGEASAARRLAWSLLAGFVLVAVVLPLTHFAS